MIERQWTGWTEDERRRKTIEATRNQLLAGLPLNAALEKARAIVDREEVGELVDRGLDIPDAVTMTLRLRPQRILPLSRQAESRVGVKLRVIGLVLPAGERERYVEQWMDERNAIRRGEFPKQRFHGFRLLCGAVVQSFETRVHARRSVE
ncbi:hypothetical protein OG241_06645 [Streptomyces sp. NBC_01390]|uniref:hypothetical protein n=1 Tax=Streptomyces sp. NBC_01390 TaxID=2903850 RepID=UPI0032544F57